MKIRNLLSLKNKFVGSEQVIKTRLIIILASAAGIGIIFTAYLFNFNIEDRANSIDSVTNNDTKATLILAEKENKSADIQPVSSIENVADKVQVFLFHDTQRCATCIAIGKLAGEMVSERFQKELKSGRIEFREINIDLPENEALAQKFQASGAALYLNAIIEEQDHIAQDTKVWRLTGDEVQFKDYLEGRINNLLGL